MVPLLVSVPMVPLNTLTPSLTPEMVPLLVSVPMAPLVLLALPSTSTPVLPPMEPVPVLPREPMLPPMVT